MCLYMDSSQSAPAGCTKNVCVCVCDKREKPPGAQLRHAELSASVPGEEDLGGWVSLQGTDAHPHPHHTPHTQHTQHTHTHTAVIKHHAVLDWHETHTHTVQKTRVISGWLVSCDRSVPSCYVSVLSKPAHLGSHTNNSGCYIIFIS